MITSQTSSSNIKSTADFLTKFTSLHTKVTIKDVCFLMRHI
jgi:hypothetical protein